METFELIRSRRSTRKFKDQAVSRERIDQIVEAGRHAPSGGNSQTTHFMVITNPEVLERLAVVVMEEFAKYEITDGMYRSKQGTIRAAKKGNYSYHYHAPVLILTANQKSYTNRIADCSCALENMMLAANELDLGSCWINQLKWLCEDENETALKALYELGMDESERVYGAVAIGYPDTEDGLPVRRPLERTGNPVTYIE